MTPQPECAADACGEVQASGEAGSPRTPWMTPGDERDSQGWGSGSVARRPSNDRAYRTSSFAANIGMVSRRPEHQGSRAVMMHRRADWHAPGLTVYMARCGPGPLVCVAFQPVAALGTASRSWTASALPAEAPDPPSRWLCVLTLCPDLFLRWL